MGKDDKIKQAAPEVYLCRDGRMRWVYDYNAWSDMGVFLLCVKILACVSAAGAAAAFLLGLHGGAEAAGILALKVLGYSAAASLVMSLAVWAASASSRGGRFCIIFEMDEKGVNRVDMQAQYRLKDALDMIEAAGRKQEDEKEAPLNIMGASRKSLYSEFRRVKRLTVQHRRRAIRLELRRSRSEVYAGKAQFDFVLDYIRAHCRPDVKVK